MKMISDIWPMVMADAGCSKPMLPRKPEVLE